MNIKRKNKEEENVLLGISKDKYLVYPDVSGMVNWLNKDKYEEIDEEPEYLLEDEDIPGRKVIEIYKGKYDLDFHLERLNWNESLSPLYFQEKRIRLALESIGAEHKNRNTGYFRETDFYFGLLIGKFETINEIIDIQNLNDESHSRFQWNKTREDFECVEQITDFEFERGLIDLCKFVSTKILSDKGNDYLFTDIYAIWKTFLLGEKWSKFGKINMADNYRPEFKCKLSRGEDVYFFDYEFNNW